MKTVIATLALSTALVFSASAQETRPNTKTTPKTEKRSTETRSSQERMNKTRYDQNQTDERIRNHVERMSADLQLNEKQKMRLEAHYSTVSREQHRSQPISETEKDRVKINQKTEARYNSEIRNILTDEQYEKYLSNKDRYDWRHAVTDDKTKGLTPEESMTPTDNRGSREKTPSGGGQHGTHPNPEK